MYGENGQVFEVPGGRVSSDRAANIRKLEPTGREVTFGVDEIIVSKTDVKGKITYANDVFLRVVDLRESEVIGQAHSFVRHPEMPRCVFQLLWDTIQSGREIFAYIVNLTANGDHYWVLAHVTPTFDKHGSVVGYHSNRRSPDRGPVDKAKALYEQLLAIERRHPRKADAIAASMEELQRVATAEHASYDEFVFSL